MATTYNLAITRNPNFNTVLGLTNTVFDRNNVRSGQMATEDQIQQLWQDIIRLEERIDYCCRDIVYWDVQVRIRDRYGNIISDYLENRRTGITRRGKNFTMTLPLKAVPKYESERISNISSNNYENDDPTACLLNTSNYALAQDLCSLLYRGNSGQYFEMSTRKTTTQLAIVIVSNSYVFQLKDVDVNGNEIQSITAPYNNKLFAEVNNDNDVIIKSLLPIDMVGSTKSYGRVFRFDLRDVTLGG